MQINQIYPHQGWNEIDPEEVWEKFQKVFKQALESRSIKKSKHYLRIHGSGFEQKPTQMRLM